MEPNLVRKVCLTRFAGSTYNIGGASVVTFRGAVLSALFVTISCAQFNKWAN